MKKLFTFFTLIFLHLISYHAHAQYTLEQIDMSYDTLAPFNTYVMDINNRGFVCGYYTNTNGDNIGFIVTRKGVQFDIDNNVIVASFDNKIVSINDNDVALVSSTIGGVTTLYKIYVADEAISAPVLVTGLGQNPVNALKINNKNDISGWYQGVNSRWLFILHDSIIPVGMPQWQASRYMPAATFYNTWGAGMDTNNVIAGFYLDAPNYYPFLYDATANSYQTLIAPTKTKVWDMNNGHTLVGEYQQANGYYMACYGTVTGNNMNATSMAPIFHNNTIQSVANGINDKGHIVGSFLDPNTNKWKGFIYRPGQDKYEYPGYSFTKHTWKTYNGLDLTPGNTDAHWNGDFFDQYIDYDLFDPYMFNGLPLNDNKIIKKYKKPHIPNTLHPDWKSFAIETDKYYTPNGSPNVQNLYKYVKKYQMFDKYVKYIRKYADTGRFNGDCYGFSITSLLSYCNPASLNSRYNLPLNTNLSSFTNMDSVSKSAITRGQLLQFNKVLQNLYPDGIFQWAGLYRTKTYMSDTAQKVNIRTFSFTLNDSGKVGGHAVFPYQIKTPQKLPFKDPVSLVTQADTLMVYDSNYPLDSTQFIAIRSDWNYIDTGYYSDYYDVMYVNFNEPTYTEIMNYPFASLKPSRNIDTTYDFSLSTGTDYTIANGGLFCTLLNGNYVNQISKLKPMLGTGLEAFYPLYFNADSLDGYAIDLKNYADSVMSITQTSDDISMGISRNALPAENDHLSVANRQISYGNPENTNKYITCHYVQTADGDPQAVNILVDSLSIVANDTVITRILHDYSYQIIHPGAAATVYNLEMYVLYNDSIKLFVANNLSLGGSTSHLIDPYYAGANGTQTVIYVDNGLNGNNDDTLFIPESPLSSNDVFRNVSYMQLYPNPASKNITISINENKEAAYTAVLADMYGKITDRMQIAHQPGTTLHTFDISAKSTGVYYVVVYDKDKKALFMQKVVKQ